MSNVPELMSVATFCKLFSVGRTTFYREVQEGRIRLRKQGTASRVSREDALAWMNNLPIIQN